MPALTNIRHERFVRSMMAGFNATDSYEYAGYKRDKKRACQLSHHPEVMARIAELRNTLEQTTLLDLNKMLVYLEQVILTPAGEVDVRSRLCQEFAQTERAGTTTLRVKMPSKMDAVEKLIKLRGWYAPEKVAMEAGDTLGDLLAKIRKG